MEYIRGYGKVWLGVVMFRQAIVDVLGKETIQSAQH